MEVKERVPKVYIIAGKARHGKDTFAGYLKDAYEENGKTAIVTHLAKYIKYYASEMTGWDLKDETKPRELLQQLGTQVIREKLGKEMLFVDRMKEDIEIFSCFYDAVIISDVRLKLEINELKKAFPDLKLIHIDRINFDNGLSEEQKKHKTEVDLDDFKDYDVEIVNTTLDKLKEDARKLYTQIER